MEQFVDVAVDVNATTTVEQLLKATIKELLSREGLPSDAETVNMLYEVSQNPLDAPILYRLIKLAKPMAH